MRGVFYKINRQILKLVEAEKGKSCLEKYFLKC